MREWYLDYHILITVIMGWLVAQLLKTLLYFYLEKKFSPERLIGSGGMPSSHSSTVCTLAVTSAFNFGLESFEFVISLVLAIIVMHDAMGVRLETEKQARVLNALMEELRSSSNNELFEQHLKEFVGHTPTQVLAGAVLGIIVGFLGQVIYTYISQGRF